MNNKCDNFERADFLRVAEEINLKGADKIIDEIIEKVTSWPIYAEAADISRELVQRVSNYHRLVS